MYLEELTSSQCSEQLLSNKYNFDKRFYEGANGEFSKTGGRS